MMVAIREIGVDDPPLIEQAFAEQGWHKPQSLYRLYLRESEAGDRTVLLALVDGRFAGYLAIVWRSNYPPFRRAGIPAIVDLNVLIALRRQGIGTRLLDEAEHRIAQVSDIAGIGVGLMPDYGAAQILYVRRGYVPDGRGLYWRGTWPEEGQQLTLDHGVALMFTKTVRKSAD